MTLNILDRFHKPEPTCPRCGRPMEPCRMCGYSDCWGCVLAGAPTQPEHNSNGHWPVRPGYERTVGR